MTERSKNGASGEALNSPAGDVNGDGDGLALEVCHLFFDDQCSKKEIGERLSISRFRVARLIEQALASGQVRIEYRDRDLIDRDLSRRLAQTYNLRLCMAVNAAGRSDEDVRGSVGSAAASVVSELVHPGDVVGLGWGRSLSAVVECLPQSAHSEVDVVQLAGGSARTAFGLDPTELARRFALRLGGRLHVIHAPAFVQSKEVRDALLCEQDISGALALFDRLSLAVLGVGALVGQGAQIPASSLSISGVLPRQELEQVLAAGALGELMLHPFDAEGRFIADPTSDRRVAVSIDQLRRTSRVVAVASGVDKAPAIQGALRSGVVTMLITDDAAARWLVDNAPLGAPRGALQLANLMAIAGPVDE